MSEVFEGLPRTDLPSAQAPARPTVLCDPLNDPRSPGYGPAGNYNAGAETARKIKGPAKQEAFDYDAQKDLGGSIAEGFRAIRERVASGGPGWDRGEEK